MLCSSRKEGGGFDGILASGNEGTWEGRLSPSRGWKVSGLPALHVCCGSPSLGVLWTSPVSSTHNWWMPKDLVKSVSASLNRDFKAHSAALAQAGWKASRASSL